MPPTPSPQLRAFTDVLPFERGPILDFALAVAGELEPGSRLLDLGAGESPYRELFGDVRYESSDWEHSVHPGARAVDHVGPAHDLPTIPDDHYDAVLCTQVLEHVPNPAEVLAEVARILRPGGRLFMTLPMTWELHELPFDFYRYTPHALDVLLHDAGFTARDIRPRNDAFATLAQLLDNAGLTLAGYPDGRDAERAAAAAELRASAAAIARHAGLERRRLLPLGYAIRAVLGGPPPAPADHDGRAAVGLADCRRRATLCFASDLLADPSLLSAYASRVGDGDDASLVIYAPDVDVALIGEALTGAVTAAGLTADSGPDLLALPYRGRAPDEGALARCVDAVLALRPPWGAFAGRPWIHPGTIEHLDDARA